MSPDSAPPTTPAEPPAERGWVWHSTLATKAAGKISVLAVVETVMACVGYWWFAFHFDTHWHLLTSIVIAPLLLLRSPESIKLGVDWFLSRLFEDWDGWPPEKRLAWGAFLATAGCLASYFACSQLTEAWLPRASGWTLFGKSVILGLLAIGVVLSGAVVGASAGAGAGGGAILVVGGLAGAVAAVSASTTGGVAVTVAVCGVLAGAGGGFISGLGLGLLLRSLTCRIAATLRYFRKGWSHLPSNWRENNLLADSTVPPELMPGVRERAVAFTLDGFLRRRRDSGYLWMRHLVFPVLAVVMFVPAILYRISIKATAWFWWPLAMLLKPVPPEDEESGERDRLTWPWRNPFQKALIILSIVIGLVTLPGHFLDAKELIQSHLPSGGKVEGVPFLLRVAQAVGWDGIRPWHWAVAVMAGCSVAMLWIAGRAVQKDENKHWPAYQKAGLRRDLWCMDMLKRLRLLATLFFWGTGILALLLETKVIPEKIPLPARQTEALREWFAGDSPVPKGDSQPR